MHILEEIIKRRRLALVVVRALLFAIGAISIQSCGSHDASGAQASQVHFVPNSQAFWDFSKNWPTN
jgi:hypothetical protein